MRLNLVTNIAKRYQEYFIIIYQEYFYRQEYYYQEKVVVKKSERSKFLSGLELREMSLG